MYNPEMRVEWNPAKAKANFDKHGVAFSEAVTALADDFALTREDPECFDEQRFITLGLSATGRLLVVVYTHREPRTADFANHLGMARQQATENLL